MQTPTPTLGIYYEHPDWFRPLFRELDRRGVPYEPVDATAHVHDPTTEPVHPVVFNRMSPSAWLRQGPEPLFYTGHWLEHLERRGVRVINGARAWRTEVSKAAQVGLLDRLGLPHPETRVLSDPSLAPGAAAEIGYPVVVKPNVGGSGAGVRLFRTSGELEVALEVGELDAGADHTLLVQEAVPAEGDRIVRVEVLDGSFLYAIRIYTTGDSFDLCPADVCRSVDGEELERTACPADAPENGLRVEGFTPPAGVREAVEAILREGGVEIGGVEYMIDARTGETVFYDVNALSNFVADAPRVVGLDPFATLADWLEREVAATNATPAEAAAPAVEVAR